MHAKITREQPPEAFLPMKISLVQETVHCIGLAKKPLGQQSIHPAFPGQVFYCLYAFFTRDKRS
jgi:hypothetical protein